MTWQMACPKATASMKREWVVTYPVSAVTTPLLMMSALMVGKVRAAIWAQTCITMMTATCNR